MEGLENETNVNKLSVPLLENHIDCNTDHPTYYIQGNTSFFRTLFNCLNALSGVGILAIPYALASGGWLCLVLLFIVALTALYAGLLIGRCMRADSTIITFPDIGERAFGNTGRRIVSIFMCIELYLAVTGFLILEGDNLNNLFPAFKIEVFGLSFGGRDALVVIAALIVLPSVFLDDLSIFSYVSASGVLATIVILASVLWVGAFEGVGFSSKGDVLNWSGIPTAVSLYGFCYGAHPVFPTLYNSMERKHHFSKMLLVCFLSMTISYAIMAIFGYLMFGSNVYSQITLNLPTNKLSSKVAIYTTLISPLTKYALMLRPVTTSAESWFPNYRRKRHFRMILRTSLVFTQVGIAIALPYFGSLMALVGAFLCVTASITVPSICYYKISGTNLKSEKILVVGTIVISLLIAVFGTYTSLVQLINHTVLRY